MRMSDIHRGRLWYSHTHTHCNSFSAVFAAGNDNYTGIAARDTANALRVLAGAVRGVAAGTKNPRTQEYILTTAQTVSVTAMEIISLCV